MVLLCCFSNMDWLDSTGGHMEMGGGHLPQLETGRGVCVCVCGGGLNKQEWGIGKDVAGRRKHWLREVPLGWPLPWAARAPACQDHMESWVECLSEESSDEKHVPLTPGLGNCREQWSATFRLAHPGQVGWHLPQAEINILCQCQVHHGPWGLSMVTAGIRSEVKKPWDRAQEEPNTSPNPGGPLSLHPTNCFAFLHHSGRHWHAKFALHSSRLPSHLPALLFVALRLAESREGLQACPACGPQPGRLSGTSELVSKDVRLLSPLTVKPSVRMPESVFFGHSNMDSVFSESLSLRLWFTQTHFQFIFSDSRGMGITKFPFSSQTYLEEGSLSRRFPSGNSPEVESP